MKFVGDKFRNGILMTSLQFKEECCYQRLAFKPSMYDNLLI
ncbi:hypothetical protein AVDCRST_MAG94-3689 [uncultured Leptolyngbya sp.]|uniref:Uncharacterized protein n=1 Tax=uncultured Leptolyngbya sp. TaxID=332963 RepID=A0A6J4MPW6_9CYAN|nr:hypothetical protein AVDCRST_MAG94-3689 [uncultured Leptolyngbya sp.]